MKRRNTEATFAVTPVSTKPESFDQDDVFDEKEENDSRETSDFSKSEASCSMETVNDHFNQLFQQLNDYLKRANEMDGLFIRRRMKHMKEKMTAINSLFDDFLHTGERLERFLKDRTNNNY